MEGPRIPLSNEPISVKEQGSILEPKTRLQFSYGDQDMKTVKRSVYETALISAVNKVCEKASRRGTCDQNIAEQLFLATVMRIFLTVGEDGIEALLRTALRDVENGDFARMLEEAGFIERVSAS